MEWQMSERKKEWQWEIKIIEYVYVYNKLSETEQLYLPLCITIVPGLHLQTHQQLQFKKESLFKVDEICKLFENNIVR